MGEERSDPRRGFLRTVTGALGALMGAVAIIPGLRFLASPLGGAPAGGAGGGDSGGSGGGKGPDDDARPVGSGGGVQPGKPVRVNVVGDRRDAWSLVRHVKLGACWLVRAREGAPVKAFSTICPHLGCGIDWNAKAGTFECPCHESAFDTDGRCLAGPSPRGLDELEVVAAGEELRVRYRRFKVGTPAKEPIG